MLLELLNENGVKVGLISSNLSAMVKKEVYEREILVAKGALPEEGIPGYYEFFFKTDSVIEPRFRLDGSVDYSSFQVLKNVSKEDILAIYHPVVKGKAGYTVKGKFIPQKMIAELPALKGRGFYRKPEEPETYRAMMRENPDVSVLSEELKKVNAKRNDLLRKIEGLNEEYAKVEEMIERGRNAYIKIDGSVYRGTTVCIGNNQHTLSNGTCYMKYTNQDGRLIGTVTVRN